MDIHGCMVLWPSIWTTQSSRDTHGHLITGGPPFSTGARTQCDQMHLRV